MTIISQLLGFFSDRAKARWLLDRGISQARKKQYKQAIENYSAAIMASGCWPEIREQALYERASAYIADGNDKLGAADLESILSGIETSINMATMARQALAKIRCSSSSAQS